MTRDGSEAQTSLDEPVLNEAFEAYYREHFGMRWPELRAALIREPRHVAWLNPHHPAPEGALPSRIERLDTLDGCAVLPPGASFPSPPRESDEPTTYYLMDGASAAAARALEVDSGDRVLDMCAAPGGKTLLLAEVASQRGFVVANDRSSDRRARLHDVLDDHLPTSARERVRVTGHDARKWGLHQQNLYDRVLVDAPCSGERHLLDDPDRLRTWSSGRPDRMAHRQYPMLCAALDAVRIGGRVVYCTCALSPTENDGVIEQLVERSADRIELLEPELPMGEPTEFGRHVLPDADDGWGPMYVAAFERVE